MIRIIVENLLLFFLPTLLYVVFVFVSRRSAGDETPVLQGAPLVWLFVTGLALMVATLVAFGTRTGGKPGEVYEPPVFKDGRIVPGHTVHTDK